MFYQIVFFFQLKTNKKVLSLDPDKDTQKKNRKRKKRDNDDYLVPEETTEEVTEEFTPFDYSKANLKMFDGQLYLLYC